MKQANRHFADLIVFYTHASLLLLANWTTSINKAFLWMVMAPAAIVLTINLIHIIKHRRFANVIAAGAGCFIAVIQFTFARIAFPQYGEGALGAAYIMAFIPWVYSLTTILTSMLLLLRKR